MNIAQSGLVEVTKELSQAIIAKAILEDGINECECVMCGSFGEYPDNIKHTSNCAYKIAEKFLIDLDDD